MTRMAYLTLRASVSLKPLAGCPEVIPNCPETGLQKEKTGQLWLLVWLWLMHESSQRSLSGWWFHIILRQSKQLLIQLALHICGFYIHKVNQPRIKNIPPKFQKVPKSRSSHCGSAATNPTSIHEGSCSIPGLTHGLRIQHCCEQWCRLQIQLGYCIAVAKAGSCSPDSNLSLGISICHRCKKKKKKKSSHTKHYTESTQMNWCEVHPAAASAFSQVFSLSPELLVRIEPHSTSFLIRELPVLCIPFVSMKKKKRFLQGN